MKANPARRTDTIAYMADRANEGLNNAKANRSDEFYTRYGDVDAELKHYAGHFTGKTVYCDCDDPFRSNFVKWFVAHFDKLGLERLICSCHDAGMNAYDGNMTLFDMLSDDGDANRNRGSGKALKAVIRHVPDDAGMASAMADDAGWNAFMHALLASDGNELTALHGNGDFRSDECMALLADADIVASNPPFSLFSDYITRIVGADRGFVALGNMNALTYNTVFPLVFDGKIWLGYHDGNMTFRVPSWYEANGEDDRRFRIDGEGRRWRSIGTAAWFTNLEIDKRHDMLALTASYAGHEDEYPRFDSYDAINVNRVADIPADYDGVMGVPITFLTKHDPEQFELVDDRDVMVMKAGRNHAEGAGVPRVLTGGLSKVNGVRKYARVLIRRKA